MAMDFGKLNFAVGFNRTSAFPLDANSYFENYDLADQAAKGATEAGKSDSAYYIGQLIIVKDIDKGVGLYQIGADNTLVKFGQASSADELVTDLSTLKGRFNNLVRDLPVTEGEDGAFNLLEPSESIPLGFFKKEEKVKLAGIEADAQVNVIEAIKVGSVSLPVSGDKSVDLGNYLTGAMHFVGVLTEKPSDLSSYEAGDVIIVDKKEYVCSENEEGTKEWHELGDEGSYLTKVEAAGKYKTIESYNNEKGALEQSIKDTAEAVAAKASKEDLNAAKNKITELETKVGKAAAGEEVATGLYKDIADEVAARQALANEVSTNKANIKTLQTNVGTSDDGANAEGSLFARVKQLSSDLAEAGKIDGITVNEVAVPIKDKIAQITLPDAFIVGLKEGEDNLVVTDGKLELAKVSTDKLVQGTKTLVLNGGNANK